MKFFISAVALFFAGVASAQVAPVGNTYVELGTKFESASSLTVGTGFAVGPVGAFGELSGDTDGNYQIRGYSDVDVGNFTLTPGVNYQWGANGGDLLGFGDSNQWGDLSADVEAKFAPGVIGGEYIFANAGVDIEGLGIAFNGGEVGAGYKLDLAENVYLDGRVSWEYDDQFDSSKPQYTVGLGLKF